MPERIQKILSSAGVASRRKSEELIRTGRVQVNGEPATIGDRAGPGVDLITVDGEPVAAQTKRYLALNKPSGYVTTVTDTHGRGTVVDLVDVPERVYPVGRLDLHTSGLLLLKVPGLPAQCGTADPVSRGGQEWKTAQPPCGSGQGPQGRDRPVPSRCRVVRDHAAPGVHAPIALPAQRRRC